MKAQRLLIVLTVINFTLLLLNMVQTKSTRAQSVAPILRVRVLEVVDERNVVRARVGVKGWVCRLTMGSDGDPSRDRAQLARCTYSRFRSLSHERCSVQSVTHNLLPAAGALEEKGNRWRP